MADQPVDHGKRRFLTATTGVIGGIGAMCAAVPFVKSWQPSAKAQLAGAPVAVDISKLEMGARQIAMWRGQPVWIIRRSPEVLAALAGNNDRLRDPDSSKNEDQQPKYAQNATRAQKDEILVLVGICTHLGCSPLFKPELQPQAFDENWKGGFFCPCHGSRFDMAGRVFQGVPAPYNLKVPPYKFVDDKHLVIGVDPDTKA